MEKNEIEKQRGKLNEKIKNLYAPIVGNRILHQLGLNYILFKEKTHLLCNIHKGSNISS